jgi:hypothetical protein
MINRSVTSRNGVSALPVISVSDFTCIILDCMASFFDMVQIDIVNFWFTSMALTQSFSDIFRPSSEIDLIYLIKHVLECFDFQFFGLILINIRFHLISLDVVFFHHLHLELRWQFKYIEDVLVNEPVLFDPNLFLILLNLSMNPLFLSLFSSIDSVRIESVNNLVFDAFIYLSNLLFK